LSNSYREIRKFHVHRDLKVDMKGEGGLQTPPC